MLAYLDEYSAEQAATYVLPVLLIFFNTVQK